MTRSISKLSIFVVASLFFLSGQAFAQDSRPPLLQDFQVDSGTYAITPSATPPLVQRTGASAPTSPATSGVRTLFPVLADVKMPGYTGILVESMEGNIVIETNSHLAFNPASNVKIATAYAVLKTFGPEFRFNTNVLTDGAIDQETGTLIGNLYVYGKDPMFASQHAVTIANELNKMGIRSISGDLIVTDGFVMNYSGSPVASGRTLYATLDSSKRTAAATRAWLSHLSHSGQAGQVPGNPGVSITGSVYVQPTPSNIRMLFVHQSAQLREILKANLSYSNNFISEKLGDMVGGPYAVARLVHLNAKIPPNELSLATSSGLGQNRVTPNAMMSLLRALRSDLKRHKMTFADIMPVAGIDKGTLSGRFDSDFALGSVVGKTGSLNNTDGGASTLAGEISTRNGPLLFVIFNQRGRVPQFRSFQNFFVSLVQGQFGGAMPATYTSTPIDIRLAKTKVSYPDLRPRKLL